MFCSWRWLFSSSSIIRCFSEISPDNSAKSSCSWFDSVRVLIYKINKIAFFRQSKAELKQQTNLKVSKITLFEERNFIFWLCLELLVVVGNYLIGNSSCILVDWQGAHTLTQWDITKSRTFQATALFIRSTSSSSTKLRPYVVIVYLAKGVNTAQHTQPEMLPQDICTVTTWH